nr:reverse transcriptase domain-containing protein [Tanacetum cinerariifolium]
SNNEAPDFIIKFLKMIQVGISHETSVAHSPQQNDVIERRNRTLIEAAHTMLIYAQAPLFLWAETVAIACYTQNRSIIRLRHEKTPYELLHNKLPDLSFLHVFGALCYPTNDSENLGKLQPKADIGFFIGYGQRKLSGFTTDSSLGPALNEMTPVPPSVDHQAPEVIAPIADVIPPVQAESTSSYFLTTVDQYAPSLSKYQTTPETQSSAISQNVEEDNHDIKVAHMGNDPLFGVPIPEITPAQSSSTVSNRGLKRILERTIGENRASWSNKLDDALCAFHIAYKTPIGCTPYKLVYGKACHLPIELEHKAYWALKQANFDFAIAGDHRKVQLNELNELRDHAYENSLIYKGKTKRIHDSKIKNRVFNVGDRVLLFNSRLKIFLGKLKTRLSGPFTITKVFPYDTVELSQANGPNFKVNGHRVKHYFRGDVPQLVSREIEILDFLKCLLHSIAWGHTISWYGDFGNGYSRKRQKQRQKRQNRARNGKDQKRQSHLKPKVKSQSPRSTKVNPRARDKYHNLEDDEMIKSIFNSGKNKEGVGMKILSWTITDEMKLIEHYQMYVVVFGIDVPTTHLAEQKSHEELEAKQNEEKVKEHLMAEEIEKLVKGMENIEENVEEEESAEDDYTLKRREKRKHVKENGHTPSPITNRPSRDSFYSYIFGY